MSNNLERSVGLFCSKLARREIVGSYLVARHTAELMRVVLSTMKKSSSVATLITTVKAVGRQLQATAPLELVIGNIVRRVLYFIHEELPDPSANLAGVLALEVKSAVIESVNEFLFELSSLHDEIGRHGQDYIVDGDAVLAVGDSMSVESLLVGARDKGRQFTTYVTSGRLAQMLSQRKIATTLVQPATVFPIMPRIHKVVMGAHAVMANGGLLAEEGSHCIALAARHFSVPCVVCTAMYKLSPLYPVDQETFGELLSPGHLLVSSSVPTGAVQAHRPRCDYVPPELVTLFITNQECMSPSYIYRLLTEFYRPEDANLEDESEENGKETTVSTAMTSASGDAKRHASAAQQQQQQQQSSSELVGMEMVTTGRDRL